MRAETPPEVAAASRALEALRPGVRVLSCPLPSDVAEGPLELTRPAPLLAWVEDGVLWMEEPGGHATRVHLGREGRVLLSVAVPAAGRVCEASRASERAVVARVVDGDGQPVADREVAGCPDGVVRRSDADGRLEARWRDGERCGFWTWQRVGPGIAVGPTAVVDGEGDVVVRATRPEDARGPADLLRALRPLLVQVDRRVARLDAGQPGVPEGLEGPAADVAARLVESWRARREALASLAADARRGDPDALARLVASPPP